MGVENEMEGEGFTNKGFRYQGEWWRLLAIILLWLHCGIYWREREKGKERLNDRGLHSEKKKGK